MRFGKNASWVKIENKMPFRSSYFYWDIEPYISSKFFHEKNIKVKYFKRAFVHKEYPLKGIIFSCWTKDEEEVEKILNLIDKKLMIIEKDYMEFMQKWHQNLLDLTREKN